MQNFNGIGESVKKHKQYLMKSNKFVPFGRPPFGKVIIHAMTEYVLSNN